LEQKKETGKRGKRNDFFRGVSSFLKIEKTPPPEKKEPTP
jgi:hypothetical protein